MRADRLNVLAAAFACLLPGAGCASSSAPARWLPYAEEAQHQAYGGWLDLGVDRGGVIDTVRGELLAISADSVYTLRGQRVTAVSLAQVRRGRLEFYDPRSGQLAATTVAGTLLTFTHGIGLVLTAPLWVIVGTASTAALSGDGKLGLDPDLPRDLPNAAPGAKREDHASWGDLRLYARFPQGWPSGLDRTTLHERPLRNPPPPAPRVPHGIAN